MSVESTRNTLLRYMNAAHGDISALAADVVYTVMATGQEAKTPQGVQQMLTYLYQIAFDATPETRNLIFGEDSAVWEGMFVGKHIGEFAGVPATQKQVRVPICVVYDVAREQIKAARIYVEMPVLMQQLQG